MKSLYLVQGDKAVLVKDGHTDVQSAEKSIRTIMQHCEMILVGFENMDAEGSLPTWWTNKIAVSEHEIVQAANYLAAGMEDGEET